MNGDKRGSAGCVPAPNVGYGAVMDAAMIVATVHLPVSLRSGCRGQVGAGTPGPLCRGSGSELSTLIWLRNLCGVGNVRVHGSVTGGCFAGIRVESGAVPCQFGCVQLEMSLSALLGLAPLRVVQQRRLARGGHWRHRRDSDPWGALRASPVLPSRRDSRPSARTVTSVWGHLRGIKRRAVRRPAAGHWPLRSLV